MVPVGSGSQIPRQSAHEGGKVVSPTHRALCQTGKGRHEQVFHYRVFGSQCVDASKYVKGQTMIQVVTPFPKTHIDVIILKGM
jgi:hypothetical protein